MQDYWWWWGIAVLLGVLELVTGTFVILILAIGCVVGGVLAWAGTGLAAQLVGTAAGALAAWLLLRSRMPRLGQRAVQADRDMILDIGERVHVDRWGDDGSAQVSYRGATWTARRASDDSSPAAPGEHRIRRIDGNRLIIVRVE